MLMNNSISKSSLHYKFFIISLSRITVLARPHNVFTTENCISVKKMEKKYIFILKKRILLHTLELQLTCQKCMMIVLTVKLCDLCERKYLPWWFTFSTCLNYQIIIIYLCDSLHISDM